MLLVRKFEDPHPASLLPKTTLIYSTTTHLFRDFLGTSAPLNTTCRNTEKLDTFYWQYKICTQTVFQYMDYIYMYLLYTQGFWFPHWERSGIYILGVAITSTVCACIWSVHWWAYCCRQSRIHTGHTSGWKYTQWQWTVSCVRTVSLSPDWKSADTYVAHKPLSQSTN
jgi:hypothetical protein